MGGRSQFKILIVGLLACLAAHLAGRCWVSFSTSTAPARAGAPAQESELLTVDPRTLQLGEVLEQSRYTHEVRVTNRTEREVRIRRFAVSCNCVAVEPASLDIPAGETRPVYVTFDMTYRDADERGLSVRPLYRAVSAELDGVGRISWTLRGTVRSRIVLDQLRVDFDEIIASGPTPPHAVAGQVTPYDDTTGVTVEGGLPHVRAEVDPAASGREFRVLLRPATDGPVGPFQTMLTVYAHRPDGARIPAARLPVRGVVVPPVRPIPTNDWLGSAAVGADLEAAITLQVPAGRDPTSVVERVEVSAPHVTVDSPPNSSEAGLTYRVRVRVTKPGDFTDQVRFVVRAENGTSSVVQTELNYRGNSPTQSSGRAPEGKK